MAKGFLRSRWTVLLLAVALCAAVALLLWSTRSRPEGPWTVRIATATKGGTYKVFGEEYADQLRLSHGAAIETAEALETKGSVDNIDRLNRSRDAEGWANLALVMQPVLESAHKEQVENLCVLARLYKDVLQVVVRNDAGIRTLGDLHAKRVFIGGSGSGTRVAALKVLEYARRVERPDLEIRTAEGMSMYVDAAKALVNGELDAAFFVAGTPTDAVAKALEDGTCHLLPLNVGRLLEHEMGTSLGLEASDIPPESYPHQSERVESVGSWVLLVGRQDLDEELVVLLLDGLFENMVESLSHRTMNLVRQDEAFRLLPPEVDRHPGVARFEELEKERLLIVTGSARGWNCALGRRIGRLLEHNGIRARVRSTHGSIENLELLAQNRPCLGIVHNDIALAALYSQNTAITKVIYGRKSEPVIPALTRIRRIAALHEAKVHVIIRREFVENEKAPTLDLVERLVEERGEPLRVCLGADDSGTLVLARTILRRHGIDPDDPRKVTPCHDEARVMAADLLDGRVELGFFVSYAPSYALRELLDSKKVRCLSLGPAARQKLLRFAGFGDAKIELGTYGCQKGDDQPIRTISTRVVLVTTEEVSADVEEICRTIFEGEAILGIEGGVDTLAMRMPSLPLHEDAKNYYREIERYPKGTSLIDRLGGPFNVAWKALAILVILTAGYRGIRGLLHSGVANRIGWRVLAIPIDAATHGSVGRLRVIAREIRDRVNRRWWQRGELDWRRWRILHDLIQERIRMARSSMKRDLVQEIHEVAQSEDLEPEKRRERLAEFGALAERRFAEGELEHSQRDGLLRLIEEVREPPA